MKLRDAIHDVLKDSAMPMGVKEIERTILKKGLYKSTAKHLYKSISSVISTNIKKYGKGALFVRCDKGRFAINGSFATEVQPELPLTIEPPKDRRKGYVYIFTNPCFNAYFKSKIVKIGQTKDVEKRRATLNTSVPVQFEIYATLLTSKYKMVEKKIHQRLKRVSAIKELREGKRVKAENGEFYLITPRQAYYVLQEESALIDDNDKILSLYKHELNSTNRKTTQKMSWKNATQLAIFLARQGRNVNAKNGIFQQLTGKRRVAKNSKWRKPMEDAGVKFDRNDMVISWRQG